MKTLVIMFFVAATLTVTALKSQSFAGNGIASGSIEYYRVHNGTIEPAWAPPKFWFTLNGVASAAACPTWASGKILFVAESKEELALIMSAFATGNAVTVWYDDQYLNNGFCRALNITVGNPPPLY